jgi:transcription initiation factor TFIIIB Brf1 subunit/transcription initiation factor TFIIB
MICSKKISTILDTDTSCYNDSVHDIYYDQVQGFRVCRNCGIIIEEQIMDPELSLPRLDFTNQKGILTREFTGTTCQKYISTLKPKYQDNLPQTLRRALRQNQHLSWLEKKEIIGLQYIKKIIEKFGLSALIRDQTINLFRKAIKDLHFRGRQIHILVYAAMYYSSRFHQNPVELDDLIQDEITHKKKVLKYYYDLIHHFNLPLPRMNCINYIVTYADELKIDNAVSNIARTLYDKIFIHRIQNNMDPKGIAVVCLYFACKITHFARSHSEIARIAKISPETLRLRVRANEKFIAPYVDTITSL